MEDDAAEPPPSAGFHRLDQALFARIISALYSSAAKEHGAKLPETALLPLHLVSRGFRDGVDQVLPGFCCYVNSADGSRRFKGRDFLIADLLRQSLSRWPSLTKLTLGIGWRNDHLNATLDSLVAGCPQLRELTLLKLGYFDIRQASFQNLSKLSALEALNLCVLEGWSQELCHMPSLRRLSVTGDIGSRSQLRLGDVPTLEELAVDAGYDQEPTEDRPGELSYLDMSTLQASTKLRSVKLHRVRVSSLVFPPTLEHLALNEVESTRRTGLQLDTQSLPALRSLHIDCVQLARDVPLDLGGCTNLSRLEMIGHLTHPLPQLQGWAELRQLCIVKVTRVNYILVNEVVHLPGLETLHIQDTRNMTESRRQLPALPSLKHLHLKGLRMAFSLPSLDMMPSLIALSIQSCPDLEMVGCLNAASSLTSLRVTDTFLHADVQLRCLHTDMQLSLVLLAATTLRELDIQWTSGEDLVIPLAALTRLETLAIKPMGTSFTLPSLWPLVRLKRCTIHSAPKLKVLNLESLWELQGPPLCLTLAGLPLVTIPDLRGAHVSELLLYEMQKPEPIEGLCNLRRLAVSEPVGEPCDLMVIGCPALEEVLGSIKCLSLRGCPRLTKVSQAVSIDTETIGFKW